MTRTAQTEPARTPRRRPAARGWLAGALVLLAAPAAAQRGGTFAAEAAVAGGEQEAYLRVLQVAGETPAHPWSVRAFSPVEIDRLLPRGGHPWEGRMRPQADSGRPSSAAVGLLRPDARVTWNSAIPYGFNDGPVWAGRGATAEVRAGAVLRAGPLSVRLEPVAFWAQNRAFQLAPTGRGGALAFADGRNPTFIDQPQRFGDEAYARVDPGESTVRLDLAGIALGVSTAAQQWGPAQDLPLLLGTNAGGFAHVFAGSSAPWRTPVGRVHGRIVWGRLEQSGYSPMQGRGAVRYATGAAAVWSPRGLRGLELGAARFFHVAWPGGGPGAADLLKVFEGITKRSLDSTGVGVDGRSSTDNQLASVFARWHLPSAGVEVYAEYAREDHSWDLLDLALEPDHQSGYTLGLRKVWRPGPARLASLRAEVQNTAASHLRQVRRQHPFYRHDSLLQGHTLRGQVLGSPFGYGGGGSALALDLYHPRGRWTVEWTRGRMGGGPDGGEVPPQAAPPVQVLHALSAESLFFLGGVDLSARLAGAADLNRNGRDVFNLNLRLGARLGL